MNMRILAIIWGLIILITLIFLYENSVDMKKDSIDLKLLSDEVENYTIIKQKNTLKINKMAFERDSLKRLNFNNKFSIQINKLQTNIDSIKHYEFIKERYYKTKFKELKERISKNN
jgi:hypothetical protein